MRRDISAFSPDLSSLYETAKFGSASGWPRRLVFVYLIIAMAGVACRPGCAQHNEWTWVGGNNVVPTCTGASFFCGTPGVYGTLGVFSAANSPGARELSTTWTDKSGNFWLFGGFGDDSGGSQGDLNDLWEFDRPTKEWKWVSGTKTLPGNYQGAPGNYGKLGQAAAANVPSGRSGASSWMDSNGNFWLYGGSRYDSPTSYAYLNDLWMFDTSTNQWTWMGGNSTDIAAPNGYPGVYGIKGQPDAANRPGSRSTAIAWPDSAGNLWLFGGVGIDSAGTQGLLNDIWRFNPRTSEWTWIGGTATLPVDPSTLPGVYGTLQQPAPGNVPGGRDMAVGWVDQQGNFWLIGGHGYDSAGTLGWLNDLWKFDPASTEWAWMGGTSLLVDATSLYAYGAPGTYGDLGIPAAGNIPGSRELPTAWTDKDGDLWMFGGYGFDAQFSFGYLNDLWKFSPATNRWTWMAGSSNITPSMIVPGVYGSMGLPALGDTPGGREGASGWTDSEGDLWLMGGVGYDSTGQPGYLNDLWKFGLSTNGLPVAATPTISPGSGTYTSVQTVTLSDSTPGATIYYVVNGAPPASKYTGPISVASSEMIEAIAEASGYANSAPASATYVMNFKVAATPTFSPAAGSYSKAQLVTISDSTPGAIIYFSTSGPPTTASQVYTGPINVSTSDTVQAIAVASGYAQSAVGSAAYAITPTNALGEWEWVSGTGTLPTCQSGSGTCGIPGVYGTAGVASPANTPGGRNSAATWMDQKGRLWLFGGQGTDATGAFGFLNDLWEFDPGSTTWTWRGGADTVGPQSGRPGVYGTKGTPDPNNVPGSRWLANTWTDSHGNFWLFGGFGLDANSLAGNLNDLWEFNPSTAVWTWKGGNRAFPAGCQQTNTCFAPGVYGTLGTAAASNSPGGRDSAVTWVDGQGNLWMFGGRGTDSTGTWGMLNDLWMFNPGTGLWTWMNGTNELLGLTYPNVLYGALAAYGEMGKPAAGNVPGGRAGGSGWTDTSGNLWLMGGWGFDAIPFYGFLNDLWKFDVTALEWTWMGGYDRASAGGFQDPVYGAEGTAAPANIPSFRQYASAVADKNRGVFWMFGGFGADSNVVVGDVNDLWSFSPTTSQWTWMSGGPGTNPAGSFGTQGVAAAANIPSNRQGAAMWIDGNGNLWVFGGNRDSTLGFDDMWLYVRANNLPPAAKPSFSVPGGTYTAAQWVAISDTTPNATIYYTTDGSTPTANSAVYPGAITVASSETIMAIAAAQGYTSSPVASATYILNLPPTFTLSGNSVTIAKGATTGNTSTITVSPANGFTGKVSLSAAVTSGPSNAQYPPTVTFGSTTPVNITGASPVTATLTISSTAASTATLAGQARPGSARPLGGAALAGLFICLSAHRRKWRTMLALVLLLAVFAGGVSACGGSGSGGGGETTIAGTTPGSYTITVTGTAGGGTSATATVSLTVQ